MQRPRPRLLESLCGRWTIGRRRRVAVALVAVSGALACGALHVVAVVKAAASSGSGVMDGMIVATPVVGLAAYVLSLAVRVLRLVTEEDRNTWKPSRYHERLKSTRNRTE